MLSDNGLRSPLTESMGDVVYIDKVSADADLHQLCDREVVCLNPYRVVQNAKLLILRFLEFYYKVFRCSAVIFVSFRIPVMFLDTSEVSKCLNTLFLLSTHL